MRSKQEELRFRTHGGAREGAGRKPLPPGKRRDVAAQWQQYQQSLAAQPELSPSDPPAPPEPQSAETLPAPAAPGTATAGNPPPAAQ